MTDPQALARALAFAPQAAVARARRKRNDTGYECYQCSAEMSPERDECRPCPQCGRDRWHVGETTEYTGVSLGGVDELATEEVARCLVCGYKCHPEDRDVTWDSYCTACHHVGAPVDLRADARERRAEDEREI